MLQLSAFNFDQTQINLATVDALVFNLIKLLFIVGFILYIFFAFLAVRQIDEMRKTIVTPFSPFVQILGVAHLLLAIAVLVFVFQYLG